MSADCAAQLHKNHLEHSAAVPSFRTVYKEQCNNFYVCSRRTLLSKIPNDASLDLCVDIIRADEWKPLLQAIRLDKSLEAVAFKSSFLGDYPELIADVGRLQLVQKMQQSIHVPALFTPEMLKTFCFALSEHLKNNTRLGSLGLVGFPFSLVHLQELSAGVRTSASLTTVTLDGSSLGKQGLEALDLQSCNVGNAGASALHDLLVKNIVLEVVDIRQNPNIDAALAKDIAKKVSSNRHGRQCQYDLLPLGKSQPVQPVSCHQRSRSAGRLQETKSAQTRWKPRSSSLGRAASTQRALKERSPSPDVPRTNRHQPCGLLASKHIEEDLRRCQETLRKEQEARQIVERKLLELFEENRQLRSQQCKGCQQVGYTLVSDALLKDIERAFIKFQVFLAASANTNREKVPQATRQSDDAVVRSATCPMVTPGYIRSVRPGSGDDLHSTRDHTGDPSTQSRPFSTQGPAPMKNIVASKPPVPPEAKPFQEFVQSKAKQIISERKNQSSSSTADPTSSVSRNKEGHKKHITSFKAAAEESLQGDRPRGMLSGTLATPLESSKRLSELLGIDQVPSKLMPSTLGSPEFFPLETLDSEAGSLGYKYEFNSSTSVASALSEAEEKNSSAKHRVTSSFASKPRTSQKPHNKNSASKSSQSSHDSTLVSSIQEEMASTGSASSSYRRPPEAPATVGYASNNAAKQFTSEQQSHQSQGSLSDAISLSLSQMPSKSFDMDTADITVSSIHSITKHKKVAKSSLRDSHRHSTPTLSNSASQGIFEVISTPSNVTLSRNQSEMSTPSTPDTTTPPQLAGSDFDGF
ncbi:uncharacterized protein LOC119456530 isoform X2 [Dermacentor silvarum]|uniref:uncharacterized protein LOC119456530 isoform X2 n=1 Tax=Dermacentor silvarum TaxID=543639 RepID=UPI002100ABF4|nr:uncharacterized protein LOC119456530 isoform X2 [Dermacentor silvarum]